MPSHTKLTCPKCSCVIPGDSVFCQVCGSKLSDPTVPKPMYSDARLRHMLSNVDKWELMDWRRVQDRSALQMTEQQKQEELERIIQNAQDIAIAKRIAVTEVERKKKKIITFVILGILSVIITAFTFTMALQGVHNWKSRNFATQEMNIDYSNVYADVVSIESRYFVCLEGGVEKIICQCQTVDGKIIWASFDVWEYPRLKIEAEYYSASNPVRLIGRVTTMESVDDGGVFVLDVRTLKE